MADTLIKNVTHEQVFEMEGLVDYQSGRVVSRTLSQGSTMSLTVFAFDAGEEISSHSASGDALVYALDGKVLVTIGDNDYELEKGQAIVMPAGIPHALKALTPFKMLLTVVFKLF